MTNHELIEWGSHSAILGAEDGVLILPTAGQDVPDPMPSAAVLGDVVAMGSLSLDAADWTAAVADLARRGYSPVAALADEPSTLGAVLLGVLSDGREILALERIALG